MSCYDNDPIQHLGPYSLAELRHLGALEAHGFLVRMRSHVTPEVPRAFALVGLKPTSLLPGAK